MQDVVVFEFGHHMTAVLSFQNLSTSIGPIEDSRYAQ
jgi:hypothetical protein